VLVMLEFVQVGAVFKFGFQARMVTLRWRDSGESSVHAISDIFVNNRKRVLT
jgi:hypothetical protein